MLDMLNTLAHYYLLAVYLDTHFKSNAPHLEHGVHASNVEVEYRRL